MESIFAFETFNAAGVWTAAIVSAALALLLGWLSASKRGVSLRTYGLFGAMSIVLGLFFAHLFYCLMRLDYVLNEQSFAHLFAFWEGGFMLYGGIAGVALAAWLAVRLTAGTGNDSLRLMDAIAPAGALLIAGVRIAEGFAGQGYGDYLWEEGFFTRFPFATFNPDYEMWAWAIFLLEALWALVIAAALLGVRKKTRPGDRTLLLLGLYAAAQIVFESLRRDEFLRWGFVRCSELFSAITLLIVLLCYHLRSARRWCKRHIISWIGLAALVIACILLEFATEERIPFLTFLSVEACYICMAGCCALLAGCVLCMRSTESALTKS